MTQPKDLELATRHLKPHGFQPRTGCAEPETEEQRRLRKLQKEQRATRATLREKQ